MRVMVVGGTGNVGEALVGQLTADPAVEHVVVAARRRPDELPLGVEWREAHLEQPLPPGLLDGADAVVHLAWMFQPSHSPSTTWAANVEGTARLLDAVAASHARALVFASSIGAYSPRTGLDPVDEGWPTHGIPTASYSVEKAYVERLLDRFELEHPSVRVVRMRPAFIFREAASVEQRRLFLGPLAPTKTLTSRGVPVLPDPGVVFQALHTDDAAAAYRSAVLGEVRGAFNLAAEPPVDMGTFAAELGARTVKVPVRAMRGLLRTAWLARLVPASPGMFDMAMRMPLLDTRRAREELGWAPRHSGPEAISALIEGMRTARGGQTPPLDPATSGALRAHEFGTGVAGHA